MFSCDSALNRGAWSGARTIDYFLHSVANEHMEHNTNSLNFHNAATWVRIFRSALIDMHISHSISFKI